MMQTIQQDTVATIEYALRDAQGYIVDQTTGDAPLVYLHGHENIIPGLEEALTGREVGDNFTVHVPPEKAYGFYQEELVQTLPREQFEGVDHLEVGMSFQADSSEGPLIATITEIHDDTVTVDGNHMLADQTLTFSIKVKAVRPATTKELEQGHIELDAPSE